MNKAVLSNRIYISKNKELFDSLISKLTYKFPNKNPSPKARPEIYCDVIDINENICSIPITRVDLIPDDYEIIDKRTTVPIKFPKPVIEVKLFEEQLEVYNKVDDSIVIKADPAWGKTFTALAIAQKLSQKTLIVVNKVDLRKQWEQEIKKVYGFYPSVIGGGKVDIDSPIVVANTQTLVKHKEKISRQFGTVIVDEVHRLPGNTFKNIVDAISARYKIGLSGTLTRKDKKHVLIYDYISKDYIEARNEREVVPKIIAINTNIEFNARRNEPWANVVNKLVQDDRYTQVVCDTAQSAAVAGHSVLVLSDRVSFLENCSYITDDSILLTGKEKDRSEIINMINNKEAKILYASSSIFAEGMNIPILSALVLAVNISDNDSLLKQMIGRITRKIDGKLNPLVFDIALNGHTGHKQFQQRLNFYINSGYEVDITDVVL